MAATRRFPVLLLSALCFALPARAAPAPEVFVPSLWDPASPPPKPDPAALKPLLIITGQDDPPFAFVLPDGTPAGFDVDLARALCGELKIACTVQARRWDTILPAVAAGAGDAAVASVAITPANLAVVDFTSPYYRTPARFVAPLAAKVGDVLPETVKGPAGAACCAFAGGPFTESHFFGEGAGIAVQRGREPLRVALDYALWRLAQDGTYADLWLKYFPISPY